MSIDFSLNKAGLDHAHEAALACLQALRAVDSASDSAPDSAFPFSNAFRVRTPNKFRDRFSTLEESHTQLMACYLAGRTLLDLASIKLPFDTNEPELEHAQSAYSDARKILPITKPYAFDVLVTLTAKAIVFVHKAAPEGITEDNLESCVKYLRYAQVTKPALAELEEELNRQYASAGTILRGLKADPGAFSPSPTSKLVVLDEEMLTKLLNRYVTEHLGCLEDAAAGKVELDGGKKAGKGKPGRKSTIERDLEWLDEFTNGLKEKRWATKAQFAEKKGIPEDTMNKALKRAQEHRGNENC